VRVNAEGPGGNARSFEHEALQVCPGAGARVKAVAAADGPQLVATELAEHGREAPGHLFPELADEVLFAPGDVVDLAAEEAAKVEEPGAGQDAECRVDRARDASHRLRLARAVRALLPGHGDEHRGVARAARAVNPARARTHGLRLNNQYGRTC
jgi:hypothetical protein